MNPGQEQMETLLKWILYSDSFVCRTLWPSRISEQSGSLNWMPDYGITFSLQLPKESVSLVPHKHFNITMHIPFPLCCSNSTVYTVHLIDASTQITRIEISEMVVEDTHTD